MDYRNPRRRHLDEDDENLQGDVKPQDDIVNIIIFTIIIMIGWLVISSVQYLFERFVLNKIVSFWGIVGMIVLLMILYYLVIKASGSGIYLFPTLATVGGGVNEEILI